jgi:hypothetical protein
MPHSRRLLNAWRAFFFLKAWKEDLAHLKQDHPLFVDGNSQPSTEAWEIMSRVATSLIMAVETYAEYYPDRPLHPWNLTTRALEHWFGEARRLFGGNFTMEELLLGLRHQDLRSEIFHSGDPKLRGKPRRKSKVGYLFTDEPLDPSKPGWYALARYPQLAERHGSTTTGF